MLTAHPVPGKRKSLDICSAFIAGAPRDAVGHVFFGVVDADLSAWQAACESGQAWYIDNAYHDGGRGHHFRVTRNALQHSGTGVSSGQRFAALGIPIKPWRTAGRHIVVCEQSAEFMRLFGEPDWTRRTLAALAQLTARPIRLRAWDRDKGKQAASLAADLADAHALVVWSSSAAVTALLEGIPVAVLGQSACAPMATPLADIERPVMRDDRAQWAGVLADNQWTLNEMRAGDAWRSLNSG